MDPYNQSTLTSTKLPILNTGKFEQWKFRNQQYLQHEHYALWEVIEFGDSYKAPLDEIAKDKGSVSEGSGSTKNKGRIMAITAEDMQKRKNDEAILKTFGGNEATKKTRKNQLKQQYGNFKAEGSDTLEQTFNRLQAIVSHLEFMDVPIEQDDLNQKFLTSLAPEWLVYTIVWRNRDDLDTMSLDDVSPKSQDRGKIESYKKDPKVEELAPKAMIAIDGIGWDWSYMAAEDEASKNHALVADEEEVPTEYALMAKSSSSSDNEMGLPEFVDDIVTDYSRPTPSIDVSKNRCTGTPHKVLDFDHLTFDCKQDIWLDKGKTWATVNHDHDNMKYPSTHKSMTPRAVLLKTGTKLIATLRPFSTARPTLNSAQPKMTSFFKPAHSKIKRPFARKLAAKNKDWVPTVRTKSPTIGLKVPTAKPIVVADKGNNRKAVKASARWIWKPKQNSFG
ncbi:hypothetical protein Tco_0183727 [Tanacetum coccineum]